MYSRFGLAGKYTTIVPLAWTIWRVCHSPMIVGFSEYSLISPITRLIYWDIVVIF